MAYDTPISEKDLPAFSAWVKRQSRIQGRDISLDVGDYDLAGLYKKVNGVDLPKGHGTDEFKKPNHPTFSQESVYHSPTMMGGRWAQENGQDVFYASPQNVRNLSESGLQNYFKKYEPGVKLVLPPHMTLMDLLRYK